MRYLYSLAFTLLIPFVLLRLWWRGRKLPAYRLRWAERFARFDFVPSGKTVIWLHTVSVGEFIAAKQIIEWLLEGADIQNDIQIVVTTTTPTGSEQVRKTFGDRVFHIYAPYDLPFCVVPFLKKVQPILAIFMETELWPNTIHRCHENGVRILLANGRLSEKSASGYRRVSRLTRPMLNKIDKAAIQNRADAERFIRLGLPPERLEITGSIKFDIAIPAEVKSRAAELKEKLSDNGRRKILIAASTHKGEDEIILTACGQIRETFPDLLLILVPRHPDRFEDVFQLCIRHGFNTVRRSQNETASDNTHILLGDTLGELLTLYGCADLAFVGGTLVNNGGHNFLEPAAWGIPVISGSSTFNFSEISQLLIANGGMLIVESSADVANIAGSLFTDDQRRADMGMAAQQVVESNRGALQKLKTIIAECITGETDPVQGSP